MVSDLRGQTMVMQWSYNCHTMVIQLSYNGHTIDCRIEVFYYLFIPLCTSGISTCASAAIRNQGRTL